jgi:hypothetical protein
MKRVLRSSAAVAAVEIVAAAAEDTAVAVVAAGIAIRSSSVCGKAEYSVRRHGSAINACSLTPTFDPPIDRAKLRMYTGNTGARP